MNTISKAVWTKFVDFTTTEYDSTVMHMTSSMGESTLLPSFVSQSPSFAR